MTLAASPQGRPVVVHTLPFVGDDAAMVVAMRAGNRAAIAAFYDRHHAHVLRTPPGRVVLAIALGLLLTTAVLASACKGVVVTPIEPIPPPSVGQIGDPCTPTGEGQAGAPGPHAVTELSVEDQFDACNSGICLVNHFQGRVSCPLGQATPPSCAGPDDTSCGAGASCVASEPHYGSYCDPTIADGAAPQCGSGLCNPNRNTCACIKNSERTGASVCDTIAHECTLYGSLPGCKTMKEQTQIRLATITARHAKRLAESGIDASAASARERAFFNEFDRLRAEILRPAMVEIGAQLEAAGHGYRIEERVESGRPLIELHLLILGAHRGSKNLIRLFAWKDSEGRPEIVAEVEMVRSPMELTRYQEIEALTREVAEQMLVEAIEQVFASNG